MDKLSKNRNFDWRKLWPDFLKINLDITHRCTLQCQRCNRAIFAARGQKVPGEDMTMENFKKVIDYFEEVYFLWSNI